MHGITDQERKHCEDLEGVLAAIHRVTSAYREIDNAKQPEDFKARLRADLPARINAMFETCRSAVYAEAF